jgi:hypothetical protein
MTLATGPRAINKHIGMLEAPLLQSFADCSPERIGMWNFGSVAGSRERLPLNRKELLRHGDPSAIANAIGRKAIRNTVPSRTSLHRHQAWGGMHTRTPIVSQGLVGSCNRKHSYPRLSDVRLHSVNPGKHKRVRLHTSDYYNMDRVREEGVPITI